MFSNKPTHWHFAARPQADGLVQGRHHVQYDDGEQEDLCLDNEEWDFMAEAAQHTRKDGELNLQPFLM